jgi:hypothetical protein
MKIYFGDDRLSFRLEKLAVSTLVIGCLVFCGCNKPKPSVAPVATEQEASQAAADHVPVYTPSPAGAQPVNVSPNGEPDLHALNRGLLRWLAANRRAPANFEDFAATAGVAIPPPPTGKKYIIAKDMHIKLVNR